MLAQRLRVSICKSSPGGMHFSSAPMKTNMTSKWEHQKTWVILWILATSQGTKPLVLTVSNFPANGSKNGRWIWNLMIVPCEPQIPLYQDNNLNLIEMGTPWKMNGWNQQPSPIKRKENDLNQTSREFCSKAVNLQGFFVTPNQGEEKFQDPSHEQKWGIIGCEVRKGT